MPKTIAFMAHEETAISFVNMGAVRKLKVSMTDNTVFEMVLDDSKLAGKAVASATFWPGDQRLGLCVTYSDPPGREAARPIKVSVGEFGQDGVQSFNETQDSMKDVAASYPDSWAAFCARLPEVLLAATVMGS